MRRATVEELGVVKRILIDSNLGVVNRLGIKNFDNFLISIINECYLYDNIGFVALTDKQISLICVKKKYQNMGIGRKLIEFGIQKGCGYIYTSEQDEAIGFFEKMGFVISGNGDDYADGSRSLRMVI